MEHDLEGNLNINNNDNRDLNHVLTYLFTIDVASPLFGSIEVRLRWCIVTESCAGLLSLLVDRLPFNSSVVF